MNKLVMLVSILRRNLSETAVSFLNENGISVTLGRYGRGTATKEIFKMFMPDREKCVLFSIMPYKLFAYLKINPIWVILFANIFSHSIERFSFHFGYV